MAVATGTPSSVNPRATFGGCGGCTYTYDPDGGCYNRQGAGNCSGNCSCAPFICGLGSQIIQRLRPETMTSAAAVALNCGTETTEDKWIARALIELASKQSAPPSAFWKYVSIGLGVLSALLAIGLVIALVNR
jgi:hypothetical protein